MRSRTSPRVAVVLGSALVLIAAGVPAATRAAAATNTACPWVGSTAPVGQRVSQLVAAMSTSQELALVAGNGSSAYAGVVPAIPALCIPAVTMEDGPSGVGEGLQGVTQLPAPVDMAATWDTATAKTYGSVIGAEQAGKGSTVDLGPTVNLVRDPRWGRAFEAYGEDPYLSGAIGAADIQGVQGTGVMAQVKHLAAYNEETNRNSPADNVIVDNRALQELYLPAFQTTTQQGAASSVMCSYSWINGTSACENNYLLSTVLNKQFAFPGFVTSDWGATHSAAPAFNAGNDIEMGNRNYYGSALTTAVNNGSVTKATLDGNVSRILTQMFTFGLFDKAPTGSSGATVSTPAHVAAGQSIAEEGAVLLRNQGNVLPFGSSVKSIAVIGDDAGSSAQSSGGGSAGVNPSSPVVTPLQGIQARAGSAATVSYAEGNSDIPAAVSLAKSSSVAVVFVSTFEGEGSDLTNISLPGTQDSLIQQVAAANPNTIVVVNSGSAVAMPWAGQVAGLIEGWYPGQSDGTAIARLLFGDVNPSGKLPVTFPQSLSDVPANTTAQWPGTNNTVQYSEGLNIGYRWYQDKNIAPLYPFGFGLSYTTFSFSGLTVTPANAHGVATVTATVTNTGTRAGAEVAQLYVGDPASTGEPVKQLKGFQRVALAAGASTQVSFTLPMHALSYWSDSANTWTTAPGSYGIFVGDSSANQPLSGTLNITSTATGNTVTVTDPAGMSSPVGAAASLTLHGSDSASGQTLTYTAAGLPAGLSTSPAGVISGTATSPGTSTVTVTATDSTGATGSTTFVWSTTVAGISAAAGPITSGLSAALCVDDASASTTNGNPITIYTCNGSPAQQFTLSGGAIQVLGKCVDVTGAGTANGTLAQLYDCNGSGAQTWQLQSNGEVVNTNSGRCLDIPNATTTPGTRLEIWDCNGGKNQVWHTTATPSVGPITSGIAGNLCVDDKAAATANGNPITIYTCNGSAAQQYTLTAGALQVLGKCVDVTAAGTTNGSLTQLYDCNGTGAQTWQPQANGSLLNPASGRCLDDPGASTTVGTQLEIWDCTGGNNQQWILPS